MTQTVLHQTFTNQALSPELSWFNPPTNWQTGPSGLIIEPDAATDFWQRTHYGFRADNGHFLFAQVSSDFVATTRVRFNPAHQYDQAGLMVRLSERCWLKTSIEYEPDGPNMLGAVVTNNAYSDWSTQAVAKSVDTLTVRITREGPTYIVHHLSADNEWIQLRVAHLHDDDGKMPVQVGLYACSPKGAGYQAIFEYLKIEK